MKKATVSAQCSEQPHEAKAVRKACQIIKTSDAGKDLTDKEILDMVFRIMPGEK